ncbi:hypothetical protein LSCM1_01671 [Leishmania martiniquensis]|uniref:Uncharacterized protein n=1 Tax=Leishmania martiniquensis TaxID=1580590 RepID=A0A836FW52_9TRYP|nr:hypothetical protein LSCM1_01671 [Leishmania martiniquensis]
MPAESAHRTPSVRTSSSHRSTIETRGVPEFDREYARQLSVAKRGRNSSVKTSQSPAPAQDSLPESQLPGSAALAASRIKDYVATRVTPPRIPPLSSITRSSEHGGKSVDPSKREKARDHTSKASAASTMDENIAGSETPLVLESTRRGGFFSGEESTTAVVLDDGQSLLLFSLKTILFVGVVLSTVLCATALVVSASADYNPSYFSSSRGSSTPRARLRDSAIPKRRWPDWLVPEFHRQVALHARRALWHVLRYVGAPRVFRFVGAVLAATKAYIWDPVYTILPRIDGDVHPMSRYISSIAAGNGEGWGLTTVTTLAASVAHSLVQLVAEPLLILGRTVQALYRWIGRSAAPFSAPPRSLHHAVSGNASSAVAAKANRTLFNTRAASSALLSLWKPLHSLWGVFISASSLADTPAPGNHSISATRVAHKGATPAGSSPSSKTEKASSRTLAEATPCATAAHEVHTTHTRRLEGALWPTLLHTYRDEMEGLARDDVWELLRSDGDATRRVEVALRDGSLVMDIVVSSQAAVQRSSQTGEGDAGEVEATRRIRQASIDARLQQWQFPRLQAFYARADSEAEKQRASAAHAAAVLAACEGRVAACERRCAPSRHEVELEVQSCRGSLGNSRVMCLNTSEGAKKEVSAQLRKCLEQLTHCRASLSPPTAGPDEQDRRLRSGEGATHEAQVALADAPEVTAATAAAPAGSLFHSEKEKQRRAESLAAAAQKCEHCVRDARSSSDADRAKQSASLEEECALPRSVSTGALSESASLPVPQAKVNGSGQWAVRGAAFDEGADSTFVHLQRALEAARAEGVRRVAACMAAAEQAQASFHSERAQMNASCAAQLSNTQLRCETVERRAAEERCGAELAALGEEMRRASTVAAKKAEAACTERLVRELSMLNSSAATAASQLQRELEEVRRGADACERSKQQAQAECGAAAQRMRLEFDAQLFKARENGAVAARQARDEEREAQQRISSRKWMLEKEQLAAQCAAETQAAVTAASDRLTTKHARDLEEAAAEAQRRTATQLRQREEACQAQSETKRKRHEEEVRDLGTRIAACRAQLVGIEETHQQTAQKARQAFYAAVVRSAEEACVEVTQRNRSVCGGVGKALEEELLKLPVDASAMDAFRQILRISVEPVRLTWRFTGTLAHAPKDGELAAARGGPARFTPLLRVSGMLAALLASVCVLTKYRRGRRFFDDTIVRLHTLIAAGETSMGARSPTLRSKRNGAGHCGDFSAFGESPLKWHVLESCMTRCSEALLAWHAMCCAVLWEWEAHALRGQWSHMNEHWATWAADAFTSLENLVGDAPALSRSRDALVRRTVSASARFFTHEDVRKLAQLHAALVQGYYGMLEVCYVELISAVANGALTERRLHEAESFAVRQAAALQKQSAAVAQLKQSLAERRQPQSPSAMKEKLEKAERRSAAQEETIALLEKQLKISRDELEKARGAVHTPAPSPRTTSEAATATGPGSATPRKVRSLQELAYSGEGSDSSNACHFCDVDRGLAAHHSPAPPPPSVSAQGSPTPFATQASTMVRNPESTRRYHKLQWNDVDMT